MASPRARLLPRLSVLLVGFVLLQRGDARFGALRLHGHALHPESEQAVSCTSLTNRGSHFTAQIGVGTPPQIFDVVADTGSDSVIVGSCLCKKAHHCNADDKCFTGTNKSSTFKMAESNSGLSDATMPVVVLTFGSGQIEAIITTDVVKVGKVSTLMEDGLLLMIDQALSIDGPFEGILGLGLPKKTQTRLLALEGPRDLKKASDDDDDYGDGEDDELTSRTEKGFLETAGVSRFSMCFNDGQDGVLRLNTKPSSSTLGSIGQMHWGLDFRGISVGNASAPVVICDESSMKPGQKSPCGAIPDSGTTVMMGPRKHIMQIFAGICANWEKCANRARRTGQPKHEAFQLLLLECESWLDKDQGLDELPKLHFHLRGAGGEEQVLEMPGVSYVLASMEEEVIHVTKHLMGVFPVEVEWPTGRRKKVCSPAFGVQDYDTQLNGPVWILGTPLFYQFQVGYELDKVPPAISFSSEPCGACTDKASLVSSDMSVTAGSRHSGRQPRQIHGPLRVPVLDTSLPL